MLQKADKDRLDKVLSIIEKAGIRFPVAELGDKMKVDKGMVSSYLAGKKPISDKFYSKFIQTFDIPEKPEDKRGLAPIQEPNKNEESLHSLIKQCGTLVETNKDLKDMLRTQMQSQAMNLPAQQHISVMLEPTLHQLALFGVGKFWSDYDEGRIELNKILLSTLGVGVVSDKLSV